MGCRRVSLVVGATLLSACAPRLDLGDDLLWSARHETGDLGEWSLGQEGGAEADAPDATVSISTDFAHGGRYSVKLSNGAVGAYRTARVWRQSVFPTDAHYSAWFYLPRGYQITNDWTIIQFRAPFPSDPTVLALFLDVDVRSLPGGELILSVFDHRGQYLRSPTPSPAVLVPVGRWFQVEAFFRNAADDTGQLTLWLDGQLDYDIHRPMGLSETVYWSPCSISQDLSPVDSAIYVDDAAIALTRFGQDEP